MPETVSDYKTKEADKYELGMAKNNAATILSNSNTLLSEHDLDFDEITDVWAELVDKLYEKGKELRKKNLGY